ncbi:hypothetical protein RFI_38804, partial [Reticulomyxa filosa]
IFLKGKNFALYKCNAIEMNSNDLKTDIASKIFCFSFFLEQKNQNGIEKSKCKSKNKILSSKKYSKKNLVQIGVEFFIFYERPKKTQTFSITNANSFCFVMVLFLNYAKHHHFKKNMMRQRTFFNFFFKKINNMLMLHEEENK